MAASRLQLITNTPVAPKQQTVFDLRIEKETLRAILMTLNQRYCAYYPVLARLLGNPKAALMLGHCLSLTKVMLKQMPEREGWFWKTGAEWERELGLSPR